MLEWDLRMRRVVMPFSHGVADESTFFYTRSSIDSKEMFLTSGKSLQTAVLMLLYVGTAAS